MDDYAHEIQERQQNSTQGKRNTFFIGVVAKKRVSFDLTLVL